MSRRNLLLLVGVVVVLVAGGLFLRSRSAQGERYRAMPAERGTIEMTVSATGTVQPVEKVAVGSQVSGTIAWLGADYNDRVRKGQVLAQLEPSLFRTAVLQAEANVSRADAALADARRQFERSKELRARNVVAQVDLDAAEAAFDQREAERKQARAALQRARVDLSHATIESPIDGIVIARSVDIGQTVAASLQAPQLFQIAGDLTRMQVETRIDEADIGRVRPGLMARFTVDAFPNDTFEGTVRQVRLEPLVEQNVVTYTTVIDVSNPEEKLKPGMTANVTIRIEMKSDVLRVPNAALRFRPAEPADGQRAGAGAGAMAAQRTSAGAGAAGGTGGASGDGARRVAREGMPRGGAGADSAAGGGAMRAPREGGNADGSGGRRAGAPPQLVYVLEPGDKLKAVRIVPGITDGTYTEVRRGDLTEGTMLVVGLVPKKGQSSSNLTPPPGMGGGGMGGRRRG